MKDKTYFFDLDFATLSAELKKLGLPDFRARQLWQAFYVNLAETIEEVTTFSKELRRSLSEHFSFSHLQEAKRLTSSDQETVKSLFVLPDGKSIETVLMHYDVRQTLCISSQAGCAMGCVFCATGQMGFGRNLTTGEIVEQVLRFARLLKQNAQNVTNVVIMGMGEPFHNYEAVMLAIGRLNDPQGFNLGARRITISTVGLVPKILQFGQENSQVNLAISLHAANDRLRASLLPIAKTYPLYELMQACREYIRLTNRRLTFEWALIDGVNDSRQDALELASLLKGMLCHVNVIPLNPTTEYAGKTTSHDNAVAFRSVLEQIDISCTIRLRRGIDIQAGCGQLASEKKMNTKWT